ncbi:hypothetical protein BZG36_00006 [Bifiguratus adelaidae]|uniref:Glycosyl transferase 64 domain-containing protein n=1 Tax=Bifiguratus adelaidae TaxID=1938954 RepID=A0A261Y858_9FUNG|nr:hypothetical protein BZG36_00006 [Bifiguratus adelaidae]
MKTLGRPCFLIVIICLFSVTFLRYEDRFNTLNAGPAPNLDADITLSQPPPTQSAYAFATIACQEDMLPLIQTLTHSLTRHHASIYPILVLIPSKWISEPTLETPLNAIQVLGGHIRTVPDHTCARAKLSLWNMKEYDKIVYIQPHSVVTHPIGHLFTLPESVATLPSSGPMIIQPSTKVYEGLLSTADERLPTVDDSIAWYFADKEEGLRHVPGVLKISDATLSKPSTSSAAHQKILERTTSIVQFDPQVLPHRIYQSLRDDWDRYYHPRWFEAWHALFRDADKLVMDSAGASSSTYDESSAVVSSDASASRQSTSIESQDDFYKRGWATPNRAADVCSTINTATDLEFPIKNKFSVLLSTYEPERQLYLVKMIKHFAKSQMVDTIYVTWHNPKKPIEQSLLDLEKSLDVPVKFLHQQTDSLNNRFNPIPSLRTSSVYIVDDDIVLPIKDIEFAFAAWQLNQNSILGHFPRAHTYDPATQKAHYQISGFNKRSHYTMVLTKSMFVKSDFLWLYTCAFDERVHAYVDTRLNCEDIAFNMLVTGTTGRSPLVVNATAIWDYGASDGISRLDGHMGERDECVARLIEVVGSRGPGKPLMTEVLKKHTALWGEFAHLPFHRASWDSWVS